MTTALIIAIILATLAVILLIIGLCYGIFNNKNLINQLKKKRKEKENDKSE